jgi:hypothetical protein
MRFVADELRLDLGALTVAEARRALEYRPGAEDRKKDTPHGLAGDGAQVKVSPLRVQCSKIKQVVVP